MCERVFDAAMRRMPSKGHACRWRTSVTELLPEEKTLQCALFLLSRRVTCNMVESGSPLYC